MDERSGGRLGSGHGNTRITFRRRDGRTIQNGGGIIRKIKIALRRIIKKNT